MLKKMSFVVAFLFLSASAFAQTATYKVDPSHSIVGFEIRHMFTKMRGHFREFEGTFKWDEKKQEGSEATFKIKAASIDTANAKRDEHLRGPDFFEVAKNPEITFKSKTVTKQGTGKFKLSGDMTMHGVTKPVTFDVEFLGAGNDPWGNNVASFSAKTTIARKDFNMSWNKALDKGGVVLGEDVTLMLEIEAAKQK